MTSLHRAQCVAIGHCLPERRLTNADLESMVDTSDEWILTRTGIRERRIIDEGQALSDLAIPAALECLDRAGVTAEQLDGIIVASCTGDHTMPATANVVQDKLGATNAWGFDLMNACTGFVSAMAIGSGFIASGQAKRVLLIGGDIMSSIVDYSDRNVCILFGDGVGAMLLEAGPEDGPGIFGSRMGSDGSGGCLLGVPASGTRIPVTAEAIARGDHFLKQEGRAVFQHAVRRMQEVTTGLLDDLGLDAQKDIDLLVPHQANLRIIDSLAKRLKLPEDKVMVNIDRVGNTTAGTIPLALYDAQEQGRLRAGTRVMSSTFGAGFSWGATYFTWGRG